MFGASKFPKIMQNFAEGINVFKKTIKEEKKGKKDTKDTLKKTTSSKKKKNKKQ